MNEMIRIVKLERLLLDHFDTAALELFDAIEVAKINEYTDEYINTLEKIKKDIEDQIAMVTTMLNAAETIAIGLARKENEK